MYSGKEELDDFHFQATGRRKGKFEARTVRLFPLHEQINRGDMILG